MKILVGIDGSPHSKAALDYVKRMAWPKGTNVAVVSAAVPMVAYTMVDAAGLRWMQTAEEDMSAQAKETEQRTDTLIDTFEGKKTAIRDMARETKTEAVEMMKTYLGDEEEALDGFEFLSMAEAGELCHWEIVERISSAIQHQKASELARWAVAVQREHVNAVREAYLELAGHEAKEMAAA